MIEKPEDIALLQTFTTAKEVAESRAKADPLIRKSEFTYDKQRMIPPIKLEDIIDARVHEVLESWAEPCCKTDWYQATILIVGQDAQMAKAPLSDYVSASLEKAKDHFDQTAILPAAELWSVPYPAPGQEAAWLWSVGYIADMGGSFKTFYDTVKTLYSRSKYAITELQDCFFADIFCGSPELRKFDLDQFETGATFVKLNMNVEHEHPDLNQHLYIIRNWAGMAIRTD